MLRGRRGEAKAIGAIRHDLLAAYFHIVRDRVPYRDTAPATYSANSKRSATP